MDGVTIEVCILGATRPEQPCPDDPFVIGHDWVPSSTTKRLADMYGNHIINEYVCTRCHLKFRKVFKLYESFKEVVLQMDLMEGGARGTASAFDEVTRVTNRAGTFAKHFEVQMSGSIDKEDFERFLGVDDERTSTIKPETV